MKHATIKWVHEKKPYDEQEIRLVEESIQSMHDSKVGGVKH